MTLAKLLTICIAGTMFLIAFFGIVNHASACTLFTRPVVYGDKSFDVFKLQVFLIQQGHEIPAGATGYYGTQTRAAVSEFQLKYSFQILFPLGLVAPTGNVYAATIAQINAINCLE